MAAVLNAHLLKGLGHLSSNANHLCCTDDDDNNNSAEVSEEAHPLSGMKSQMCLHYGASERGRPQAKEGQVENSQPQDLSTAAQTENSVQTSVWSSSNNQTSRTVLKPQASGSSSLTPDPVFEKCTDMERDIQRTQTKRQLSDTSKGHTSRDTKKTTMGGAKQKGGAEQKGEAVQKGGTEQKGGDEKKGGVEHKGRAEQKGGAEQNRKAEQEGWTEQKGGAEQKGEDEKRGGADQKGGAEQARASHPARSLENRTNQGSSNRSVSSFNRPGSRKELISNSDDFNRIDTYAINAGKELKHKKIFSVQTIAQTITEGASTDLERLRAIWIWLCYNIEYDVNGYLGFTEKACCPEQVIETGRGLCCGYSTVCFHMCKEVGIKCREVAGHGKGVGYRQARSYQNSKSNHSWNAVLLDGHWYLLDACWGAGTVDMDNRVFMKRYNEFYFLTDPEDFITSHCPDEEEWQLLENPIKREEFEKMVIKTSEFYRLGLTLIHPEHFLLITENGEASISMGFSQPVDVNYQIFQGCEQKELSSSVGLLTITQTGMKLRLLPPTEGLFEVMLFARPGGTSGVFRWVCSFQVECPVPRAAEDLPENPFLCWGLQQSSDGLGLKPWACGNETIMLKGGSFQLVLQTTRPLMMLCELSHEDLDETLAKRCLATQIEDDKLTCNVLCPYTGYYRLSVFVRDYDRAADSFQNAGNFLLRCTGNTMNLNELFPPALSNYCGPGVSTSLAGLSAFSHMEAIVSTQQGELNITFQNKRDLDIHAVLSKDQRPPAGHALSRHVFLTHIGTEVTVSVTLPEPGVFKLSLYACVLPGQDFTPLCDFVVRNSCEARRPPFPLAYAAWEKGSELLEPRCGVLRSHSRVRVRARVPGALRVYTLGERTTELNLDGSGVWEGEVLTGGGGGILQLAAGWDHTSGDLAILLCFYVQDE